MNMNKTNIRGNNRLAHLSTVLKYDIVFLYTLELLNDLEHVSDKKQFSDQFINFSEQLRSPSLISTVTMLAIE